jgi:hypothetical protein
MVKDQQMMAAARNIANEWLTEDPNLSSESSTPIREELFRLKKKKSDWSGIS